MSLNTIALIPARYAATRFPAKLMQPLAGKPVIVHTYLNTLHTGLFKAVWVATDSPLILQAIEQAGGQAILTQSSHCSGTDRIAEAAQQLEADLILNVQGDEPFVNQTALSALIAAFNKQPTLQAASLMQPLSDPQKINDPNYVKVVVDKNNRALLFSRSPIPFARDPETAATYFEHIGVYAFTKAALIQFAQLPATPLERIEKIECLRLLENGIGIQMVETTYMGIEIDTPEDLKNAERLFHRS